MVGCTQVRRSTRRAMVITALVAVLALLAAVPAHAQRGRGGPGRGANAVVTADFTCTTVDAESTKDLSNVVLEFADGTVERFEDLSGHTGTFAGTGDNAGKLIARAFVKSGANFSGEGPGYGEAFTNDADCESDDPGTEDPGTGDPTCENGEVYDPILGCVPEDGGGGGGISIS